MSCDIVIAHYKEDINWIKELRHNYIRNINLYTKSKNSKIFANNINYEKLNPKLIHSYLPNIGRESHSYLHYCVTNYNSLPSFVFFFQGDPTAHGFNIDKIMEWINIVAVSPTITHTDNFSISTLYLGLDNGRRPNWAGSDCTMSQYGMYHWFKRYIYEEEINEHQCKIYFGANFGVSSDRILSRDISEYKNLIDNELNSLNPEAGHFMERSWFYFFNLHKI